MGSSSKLLRLSARGLKKSYGRRPVVRNVTLSVRQGEIVGLLGPNGAGKTTCFHMICGLISLNSGRIFLGQHDITRYPIHMRARLGIGYLPQESSIFQGLTVAENLDIILASHHQSRLARLRRREKLLRVFRLKHLARQDARSLSGGERRRLEIARILSVNPRFVLFDEPFAGVDPIAAEEINLLMRALTQQNIGVLITDHNVATTFRMVDRVYLLHDGKIAVSGSSEEVANNDIARELYLGENFRY
ncbi:MAG: LPS export ABC transporter ATP-binding protein [Alphaproteobacteria bacterium]|nr:LPS export ABC transporter ATP-binding protein [Alphaproteobacteria bacterium]